ncbi:unnamed protein product [Adineta steineri]|uniref:Uncharacterized protein n=1 Tax=Adineta steineri TaxID=433720 RepID=A0A819W7N2_9BILA|nr:unnamed protein product [Adineta steineri]
MGDFIKPIREQLKLYDNDLNNDIEEFNKKLNITRTNLFDYIDRQIELLNNIKQKYADEFNYLERENNKTCEINRHEFDKFCLLINQNDENPIKATNVLENIKKVFPFRPNMLKNIPEYFFQDISIDDCIKKKESLSPIVSDNKFIPINDNIQIPASSIGHSYHKQIAEQNNEIETPPESRLVSTCSTISVADEMIDLSFRIPYQHNRRPCSITYNDDEKFLLIYSASIHSLEYICLESRRIFKINLPFDDRILNLGYSQRKQLFYFSTRETNRLVLFRLNEKQIEIVEEINLIGENDYFINVHIYENFIFFLYGSSSIIMFGKYDLENSSHLPSFSFENKLYDSQEKSKYKIFDFAINYSYISFLIQLKTNNKFMIFIHDYDNMHKLHSFDLIDAKKPLSIVATEKKTKSTVTTMCNDEIKLLLFVNDLNGHLIHCCTHEQYLIPIQVNAFGICPLDDGNLSLVASKDIRGLKVQDHLKRNDV